MPGDLTPGHTYAPNGEVTADNLKALVEQAVIRAGAVTPSKLHDSNIGEGLKRDADTAPMRLHFDGEAFEVDATEGLRPIRIEENKTYSVHGSDPDYADLHAAFAALERRRIAPGVTVTLEVAAGSHAYSAPLRPRHVDGGRVRILGQESGTTVLEFSSEVAIALEAGVLGGLDKLTLRGSGGAAACAIRATRGAALAAGPDLVIENFAGDTAEGAVEATGGAVVLADGLKIDNCASGGVYAAAGGAVVARDSEVSGGPHGYYAEAGTIIAAGAMAVATAGHGFEATRGGLVDANGATAKDNGGDGFLARDAGTVLAGAGDSVNNGGAGYRTQTLGRLTPGTASGNGDGAQVYARSGLMTEFMCLYDKKSAGTPGQNFPSGSWTRHHITEIHRDDSGLVTIVEDRVRLPPGIYQCDIYMPNFIADGNNWARTAARLADTASNVLLIGTSAINTHDRGSQISHTIAGSFDLEEETDLEIQVRPTQGLNQWTSNIDGQDELYLVARFWRETPAV